MAQSRFVARCFGSVALSLIVGIVAPKVTQAEDLKQIFEKVQQ